MNWEFPVQQQKEKRLSADEVLNLPIGSKVIINGDDAKHQQTLCIVAGHPTRKFLTYRTKNGMVKFCAIKDYEGKYYTKGNG